MSTLVHLLFYKDSSQFDILSYRKNTFAHITRGSRSIRRLLVDKSRMGLSTTNSPRRIRAESGKKRSSDWFISLPQVSSVWHGGYLGPL